MAGRIELSSGNAGLAGVSYYDLVLFVVPMPLLVGLLVDELLGLPSKTGLLTGAALSALVVGHGLFFDPPTRRRPRDGESRGPTNGPSA